MNDQSQDPQLALALELSLGNEYDEDYLLALQLQQVASCNGVFQNNLSILCLRPRVFNLKKKQKNNEF